MGFFIFMQQNGWIKLHRKTIEKGFYKKSQYVHLWVHLLLNVNHEPKEFMWNGNIILIKEGQMVTGRNELSDQTGIPQSTIEDILKFLETQHQIQQQKTTKYRLITIVNWIKHQSSDSKSNNRATTEQQQADTNKNEEKVKNEKKERPHASIAYLKEIPIEDIKEFTHRFEISEKGVRSKAEDLLLYCERKGKVYKNYKAFLLNAVKKDCKEREVRKTEKIEEKTEMTEEEKIISRASLDKLRVEMMSKNILTPKK